ncbi:cob(I)yrinic acid a,c-diamide adenosyltransferase [Geothermobacter hydrogeniphilus]|uniref:Corrinoid adenosyltransferase n=1 Tax=Geothermobacter hydrogeniphilus TaxID=1969733 RepID=A0A1X0XZJ3_9BACT|nr:cob(I)yrinic acid a,c-diamide adenosyltransferase [Geothermobacter hydrogeniphilus]ORJ58276.1 ATP:cob(I)alamin adenosyltransferase [Geothermobacter hydrogeniphilus]
MVKLDRITTGGGDKGQTSLVDGSRVPKQSLRVEAYGGVDELNSLFGVVLLEALPQGVGPELERIQNDLFDLGADFATPSDGAVGERALRITDNHVKRLEAEVDRVTALLEPLTSFVLPGGTRAGALLHLARATARRVERQAWRLVEEEGVEKINPRALTYLNRLSDLCFVWARLANDGGRADRLWQPCDNC